MCNLTYTIGIVVFNDVKLVVVKTSHTKTCLTLLNTTIPIVPVELHKTKKLSPAGKEYLCFRINSRSSHAAQCVKSQIMNNVIDSIISIDAFEKKCAVIKCMLLSSCLDDHMKTIGIDKSLCNRSSFEHMYEQHPKDISTYRKV